MFTAAIAVFDGNMEFLYFEQEDISMKTIFKILIAGIVGLAVMWLCYQVFHLEQVMTTVVAIAATIATVAVCDKIKPQK